MSGNEGFPGVQIFSAQTGTVSGKPGQLALFPISEVALKIDIQLIGRGRERVEDGRLVGARPLVTSACFLLARTVSWPHPAARETGKCSLAVCPKEKRNWFGDELAVSAMEGK